MLKKLQAQIKLLAKENFELTEKLVNTIENGLEYNLKYDYYNASIFILDKSARNAVI